MAKKKLTTAEILAAARAEAAGAAPAATAYEKAAPETDGDSTAALAGTGKPPKSTADILAAARAQASGETKAAVLGAAAAEPKSTANILAAARAQTAGGQSKSAAPPAKRKQQLAQAPAAESNPTGDLPSVQEMVKAVRENRAGRQGAVPAAPARPPLPKRPARPTTNESRRFALASILLSPFALAWVLFTAASTVFTLAMARFAMPNVLIEPPTRFKIGPPSDYPPEAVSAKWKAERGIWVVNTAQYDGKQLIYALASVCTHLGCTPNWLDGEQKFKCPCHGSGFYISGVNFEGPAPRPLERVGLRLAEDGMLEVDKSVKFQEEMGQWEDAASFYEVA